MNRIYSRYCFLNAKECRLGEQAKPDVENARCNASVQKDRGRVRVRNREPAMGHVVPILQEEVQEPTMGSTRSSRSDPFFQPGFVQIAREPTVIVRMCSTDSEQLSGRLEGETKKNSLYASAEVAPERVMGLTAERDDLLLRFNYYNVSKDSLKRKVSQ